MDKRGQTNVEYLLIVAVGVILALFAILGVLHLMGIIEDEVSYLREFQGRVVEVLKS